MLVDTFTFNAPSVGFGYTVISVPERSEIPTELIVPHSDVSDPHALLATTAYTPFIEAVNVVPVAPAIGVKSEQLIH